MLAITLTQPWASLVAIGAKQFETRDWDTDVRCQIAIHAGKNLAPVGGKRGFLRTVHSRPFCNALFDTGPFEHAMQLPMGAVVAVADLVETIKSPGWPPPGAPDFEEAFGDFTAGRFLFELRGVRPLKTPVPARGFQKFWTLPAGVERQVREQLS
ncbi:MAG TPA: hypothetical protein VGK41_08285 [Solirubrobacterales bacterium]